LRKAVDALLQAERADATEPPAPGAHAMLMEAQEVTEEAISWLWHPYVARKKLHALDGDPGIGKTMWALQLAACVSRGHPMPDQMGKPTIATGEPANVLLV